MKNDVIVLERIREGLCPICGKKSEGRTTLVESGKFGAVVICGHHIVQGQDKLQE